MSIINSNLFHLSEEDLNLNKNEIINKLEEIQAEEITELEDNTSKNKNIISSMSKLRNSFQSTEDIEFKEINIDTSNFSEFHYELMNNKHLAVIHDKENNSYKYLTPKGIVFITQDLNIVSIINNTPITRKIAFGYIPLIDASNIKSLSLLTSIFFNENIENPKELLEFYLSKDFQINKFDEYSINYHLLSIYPRIEGIVNTFNYWAYINLEQAIYNTNYKDLPSNLIKKDMIDTQKEYYYETLSKICEELNINIDIDIINDDKNLLYLFNSSNELFPTLNKEFIKLLDYPKLKIINNCINNIKLIQYIEKYNSYPKSTITHNQYGLISDIKLDISLNLTNKKILRGTFNNSFYKVLVALIHNKEYRALLSEEDSLIKNLLDNTLKTNQIQTMSFCIENLIKGKLLGVQYGQEMITYFEKELKTSLYEEDYEEIEEVLSSNEKLKELMNLIEMFNDPIKNKKLLYHSDLTDLSVTILDKLRLLQKRFILEIDEYCNDFNSKNKAQMNILSFDNDNIYLIADNEAFDTAFDTLSRIMPSSFSKCCKSVNSSCYIEVLK